MTKEFIKTRIHDEVKRFKGHHLDQVNQVDWFVMNKIEDAVKAKVQSTVEQGLIPFDETKQSYDAIRAEVFKLMSGAIDDQLK